MSYVDHFKLADDLITHLNGVIGGLVDPFISSRYIGFVAIAATTVYELAIKEIFIAFGEQKHKVFGQFAGSYFERINGRIKTSHLKDDYLPRFGEKYVKRYKAKEQKIEQLFLRSNGVSVLASYNNLIEWRNQFAHEGRIPSTVTYAEVTQAYEVGKEIIRALAETMRL
jgi:hypothetical protein